MQPNNALVTGPTFEEMLHPDKIDPAIREKALRARQEDPLDPINLYNITWRDPQGRIYYDILPRELTGVDAPIAVLYAKDLPTGSHKVGAAYSVLLEKGLSGEVDPRPRTRWFGPLPATMASVAPGWAAGCATTRW